jgi:formylglycine-generating enzyme required for sulfatase activity
MSTMSTEEFRVLLETSEGGPDPKVSPERVDRSRSILPRLFSHTSKPMRWLTLALPVAASHETEHHKWLKAAAKRVGQGIPPPANDAWAEPVALQFEWYTDCLLAAAGKPTSPLTVLHAAEPNAGPCLRAAWLIDAIRDMSAGEPQRPLKVPGQDHWVTCQVPVVYEQGGQGHTAHLHLWLVPLVDGHAHPDNQLACVPHPASACLPLTTSFVAAQTHITQWLRALCAGRAVPPMALAWHLEPHDGATLDAASGASASVAMAIGAAWLIRQHLPGPWRDALDTIGSDARTHDLHKLRVSAVFRWDGDPDHPPTLGPVASVKEKQTALMPWFAGQALPLYLSPEQEVHSQAQRSDIALDAERKDVLQLLQHFGKSLIPLTADQRKLLGILIHSPAGELPHSVERSTINGVINAVHDERFAHTIGHVLHMWALCDDMGDNGWTRVHSHFVALKVDDGQRTEAYVQFSDVQRAHEEKDSLGIPCSRYKGYLITGESGAGKSTLMRANAQLMYQQLLQALWEPQAGGGMLEVPLLIDLKDIPASLQLDTADGLRTHLMARHAGPKDCLVNDLKGRMHWRVLLDGLNEVPVQAPTSRAERVHEIYKACRALAPAAPMLLTMRKEYSDACAIDSLLNVEVKAWCLEAINGYIDKRFADKLADPHVKQLRNDIQQNDGVRELCGNPLNLSLQCAVIDEGGASFTDRGSLYCAWLWMRLHKEFVKKPGGLNKLQGLVDRGWLTEDDQSAIRAKPDWKLQTWREHKLYQLPVDNVLLGRLMDQAEDQYWLDVKNKVDQSERCKVQVDFDEVKQRFAGNSQDAEDWARYLSELNLVRWDAIGRTFKFVHQSWGELFAAYRLMRWSPEDLKQKRLHGTPAEQARAETLHHRLFEQARMKDCPSADQELANQQKEADDAWAPLMAVKDMLLESLRIEPLGAKITDFGDAESFDQLRQCHPSFYFEGGFLVKGDAAGGGTVEIVNMGIEVWGNLSRLVTGSQGLWHESLIVWRHLVNLSMWPQFKVEFWSRVRRVLLVALRGDTDEAYVVADRQVSSMQKAPGRLTLPPVGELRDVLSLALEALPNESASAWMQALVCEGGDWRMTVHAAARLRNRLEPVGQGGVRLAWWPPEQPSSVLNHLRRLLLLTSVDAGEACKERLGLGGLLQLLDAPMLDTPALNLHWQQVRQQQAFNHGVDLRWRLWAAEGLSDLKDNIRWQRVELPDTGQVGLVLKPALWLWVGRSGGQHHFQMGGDAAWSDCQPAYLQCLRSFRVAAYPAVVMEYRAFLESHAARPLPKNDFSHDLQPIAGLDWDAMGRFEQWQAALVQQIMPDGCLSKPTEEEWEAAARAAPQDHMDRGAEIYPFSLTGNPVDEADLRFVFNHAATGLQRTAPVGVFSMSLNAIGAEMSGNVWQRCANRWDGQKDYSDAKGFLQPASMKAAVWQQRVMPNEHIVANEMLAVRGGSYVNPAHFAKAASRLHGPAGYVNDCLGVRWVLLPQDHRH